MVNSLLSTKLYFPKVRPSFVKRPRLIQRLETGLRGPLTLVSAPAGSGKTTLMAEWRQDAGQAVPAAWFSVDSADNDPILFFQYLITALDSIHSGLVREILPLLQTAEQSSLNSALTILINALAQIDQDFVLVLDDYHFIDNPAIDQLLTSILEHLPPKMHLVILTRADPALPLARLRAGNQMVEIRIEHLRFQVGECVQFINQVMSLNLAVEQVTALEKRTEGWVAGLQLAAISMQGQQNMDSFISAFTGSHRYIVDYFAEEVFSRQPEALQEFFLRTSILERFTASLCDALTNESNGEEMLDKLDHANLFVVPLDDNRHWFRYHHLFTDLLRSRLLHTHPEMVSALHIKASGWFEAHGYLDEAIEHALEAKKYPLAAHLFCQDSIQIIYTRSLNTLERWLNAFPDEYITSDPWLSIAKAHIYWVAGRRDTLEPFVLAAQKAYANQVATGQRQVDDPESRILQGEILTFQAVCAMRKGELALATKKSQAALAAFPEKSRNHAFALSSLYLIYENSGEIHQAAQICSETIAVARDLKNPYTQSAATYTLSSLLWVQGCLHEAFQVLQETREQLQCQGQERLFFNGLLYIGQAEILYEWNRLEEMQAALETGLALCRQGGMNMFLFMGMIDLAFLKLAQGEWSTALNLLDEVERDFQGMDPATYQDPVQVYRLKWRAEQGNTAGLAEWIKRIDLNVEEKISNNRYVHLYLASRFLYHLGRYDEALLILEKVAEISCKNQYLTWLIMVLALQAVIRKKDNDEGKALHCLQQALELAEPEDSMRAFLDLGDPMRELLLLYQKRSGGSVFINRILIGFDPLVAKEEAQAVKFGFLSKREVELLRLIAEGSSNKEIAAQLYITVGTVKRHTVNIFTKLDVKNRTEAVARARQLGLL